MATQFVYNRTYQVLICVPCGCCIKPEPVSQAKHLRKDPHRLSGPLLQHTLALFASHNHICGPDEAPYPSVPIPAIPQLAITEVVGCRLCGTWQPGKSLKVTQSHISVIHRVPPKDQNGDTHYRRFSAQTWFVENKAIQYFEVITTPTPGSVEGLGLPADARQVDFFQRLRQGRAQEAEQRHMAVAEIEGFGAHKSEVVTWAKTLGIAEHLTGLPTQVILDSVRLSHHKSATLSPWLSFIAKQTNQVLHDARFYTLPGPQTLLPYGNQVTMTSTRSDGPLDGRTHRWRNQPSEMTLRNYFRYWADFVLYFLSIHKHSYAPNEDLGCHRYWWPELSERPDGVTIPQDSLELSPNQRRLCTQLYNVARHVDDSVDVDVGVKDEVNTLLMDLFVDILKTATGPNAYCSTLVSFVALLAIKPKTRGWIEAGGLSHYFSGLIWVSQLVLFDSCRRECGTRVSAPGVLMQTMQEVFARFGRSVTEAPLGHLLAWRDLLFAVARQSSAEQEVVWNDDYTIMTFGPTTLHRNDIKALLVHQYDQAHKLLYNTLMFGDYTITRMKPRMFKDDSHNKVAGVSLLDINKDQVGYNPYSLEEAIENSVPLRQAYIHISESCASWHVDAITLYEAYVQEFLRHLLVIIHIGAGQPLRSSEILSVKWQNTQNQPRNIFVHDGRVMLRTSYHKGLSTTGYVKDNMRFLPAAFGELLLDFLAYVQPLRCEFLKQTNPGQNLSPFVWSPADRMWPQSSVTESIKSACRSSGAEEFGVRTWRQLTVAICEHFFHKDKSSFDLEDEDDEFSDDEEQFHAFHVQRNHKPDTARRSYANQYSYSGMGDSAIQRSKTASALWHDWLGISVDLAGSSKRRLVEPASDQSENPFVKRLMNTRPREIKSYTDKELAVKAGELLGTPSFTWRPGQLKLLRYIMQGNKDIVAVLPTGSGKSLSFMLPCKLPGAKTTVLLLPLVSLRVDMARRLGELRVDFSIWSEESQVESKLVLVSFEAAMTATFRSYLNRLSVRQALDRVIVDECHFTIIARDYRPIMDTVGELRYVGTQFVYLTATLPPSLIPEFNNVNKLHRPHIIRESVNRPNIRYSVLYNGEKSHTLHQVAAVYIRGAYRTLLERADYNHRDKVIVYCRSKTKVRQLAGLLDCESYTSESGTPMAKEAVIERWLQSDVPYIVASSALGVGFDYAHVRTVWHIGPPTSLIDFAQESGRAGRDGAMAASFVLLDDPFKPDFSTCLPGSDGAAMLAYLTRDQRCFRVKITQYLDGDTEGVAACQDAELACSNCVPLLSGSVGKPSSTSPLKPSMRDPSLVTVPTTSSGFTSSRTAKQVGTSFVSSRTLLPDQAVSALASATAVKREPLAERGINLRPFVPPTVSKMGTTAMAISSFGRPLFPNNVPPSRDVSVPIAAVSLDTNASKVVPVGDGCGGGSSTLTSPSSVGPSNPASDQEQLPWQRALGQPCQPSVESIDLSSIGSSDNVQISKPVLLTSNPGPSSPSFASSALTPSPLGNTSSSSINGTSSRSSSTTMSGRAILLSEASKTQMTVDRFREDVMALQGTCAYCRGSKRDFGHAFSACQFKNIFLSAKAEYASHHPRWLKAYTACYYCYLPQSVCNRPSSIGQSPTGQQKSSGPKCRFPDTLLPWLFGTWQRDPDSLYYEFEVRVGTETEFFDWFATPCALGKDKWTRGAVFMANHLTQHPLS